MRSRELRIAPRCLNRFVGLVQASYVATRDDPLHLFFIVEILIPILDLFPKAALRNH
jgi:hypothetical protein